MVVCSADRSEQLDRALSSIEQLASPMLEVVVVDNGRADTRATEAVVAAHHARYVREPIAGLDRARNLGISEARER